ncbi:MAG: cupin domain-containing protein [Candidatus Dadabacteria bacterium]|nr:cupin domain-containing protein [Candidatus Dadabacteria bacterium]NIS08763.1 cupin domain-containing protein [Candidatus Dadabacteria bacterium]NIV42706.1 cupin domain-containing protein [Candidatus Dadabacteria bacterium]NIX15449.1 cupin domain-containing protein [Candidatus Dadabacteria bacterium]NIY22111.1 cupin domain-containing protein [Candidatus Dadabacteria bacterium]
MKAKNIYSNLPDNLPEEIFETLVSSDNIKIERIISPRNHKTPGGRWFSQDTDEFVILLQGSAELFFKENNKIIKLKPGDYINIPRHKEHRVESTDKQTETIWLAAHYK